MQRKSVNAKSKLITVAAVAVVAASCSLLLTGCEKSEEVGANAEQVRTSGVEPAEQEYGVFRDYSYKASSPNKKKVAFMSIKDVRNGNPKLYVKDLESKVETQLTKGPQIDSYPVWSPDGKSLAFISTRDACYEIYRMDLDTKEIHRLTYNFGGKIYPGSLSWTEQYSIEYLLWEKGKWVKKKTPSKVDFSKLDFDKDGIPNSRDDDIDGDGVANDKDNAALVANPNQLDSDYDGKGDACDNNIFLRAATFDPLTEAENYPINVSNPYGINEDDKVAQLSKDEAMVESL